MGTENGGSERPDALLDWQTFAGRSFEPVVAHHGTWIAVNPVQGCPKGCDYCYLTARAQTRHRPWELMSPRGTVQIIQTVPYYSSDAILALYTCTDALSTPRNRQHLRCLLSELREANVRNPVCLITKCGITQPIVDELRLRKKLGLLTIVYLSYSGLDSSIEKGVDHNVLRSNFPLLAQESIPVVHYWRPFIPQNGTAARMSSVLDWSSRFATCSVAVGLKVTEPEIDSLLRLWPDLANYLPDAFVADSVWPEEAWTFIHSVGKYYPRYPIYHENTCALAYIMGRADWAGAYLGDPCLHHSVCPQTQRDRCREASVRNEGRLTRVEITEVARKLGMRPEAIEFNESTGRLTVVGAGVRTAANAVAAQLHRPVANGRSIRRDYWMSKTLGGRPLVIPATARK